MPELAVVAADRALNEMLEKLGDPGPELGATLRDLAISAARAALEASHGENTVVLELPEPTDTYTHLMEPMRGWSLPNDLPYYVEYLPNGGNGQVELEHDDKRLTPLPLSDAMSLGIALIAASRE